MELVEGLYVTVASHAISYFNWLKGERCVIEKVRRYDCIIRDPEGLKWSILKTELTPVITKLSKRWN